MDDHFDVQIADDKLDLTSRSRFPRSPRTLTEVVPISHLRHSEAQRLPVSHATDRGRLAAVSADPRTTDAVAEKSHGAPPGGERARPHKEHGPCMTVWFLGR